jgi:hypothetical protein
LGYIKKAMTSSEAQRRATAKYKKTHREKSNDSERFRQFKKYVCKNPFLQAWKELMLMEI